VYLGGQYLRIECEMPAEILRILPRLAGYASRQLSPREPAFLAMKLELGRGYNGFADPVAADNRPVNYSARGSSELYCLRFIRYFIVSTSRLVEIPRRDIEGDPDVFPINVSSSPFPVPFFPSQTSRRIKMYFRRRRAKERGEDPRIPL